MKSARSQFSTMNQICIFIPAHLVAKLARKHGVDKQARTFTPWSHAIDSSTIQLVANCIDWAKHRRKKAAAKLHMRLDLQSFLPKFAIIDTAKHNDNKRARELCAEVGAGEIVLLDKGLCGF